MRKKNWIPGEMGGREKAKRGKTSHIWAVGRVPLAVGRSIESNNPPSRQREDIIYIGRADYKAKRIYYANLACM